MNAKWHMSHVMPRPATLDQRVRWHLAHARHCGCRTLPAGIVAELRRRGVAAPPRPTAVRPARRVRP